MSPVFCVQRFFTSMIKWTDIFDNLPHHVVQMHNILEALSKSWYIKIRYITIDKGGIRICFSSPKNKPKTSWTK